MSSSALLSGHLAACLLLAERFGAVTGGHGRAHVEALPDGGVTLSFSQGCPHGQQSSDHELVYSDRLSLLRALDSLSHHVSRALRANVEGLELAALKVTRTDDHRGLVRLGFYCPAWHELNFVPCRYHALVIPNGRHVTLEPIGPAQLPAEQSIGWDAMYEAGLVGCLERVLPLAAQALAQLLMLSDRLGIALPAVLLTGDHRRYSAYPGTGFTLTELDVAARFWNVNPRGNVLLVEGANGDVELNLAWLQELNAALVRWQTIAEAITEGATEDC